MSLRRLLGGGTQEVFSFMKVLILKLNATGDVVRTSSLLRRFNGEITWITDRRNQVLLEGTDHLRCFNWDEKELADDRSYDLVINLEDDEASARFASGLGASRIFGACWCESGKVSYTRDSQRWFDMSLISEYGRIKADQLKLQNRYTYQHLIFEGLGFKFRGEKYVLPRAVNSNLSGDVAIAPEAGPVWPMKKWGYYDQLRRELEERGLTVNMLPRRDTLLEHLGDVQNHRCLVSGDSLPMHFALGSGIPCVTLFNCTSPWEIHDYGIQTKLISPLLSEFFYQRGFDERATTAIPLEAVLSSVLKILRMEAQKSVLVGS